MSYHKPVLAKESIEYLNIKSGGVYVDATFGGGGHAKIILEKLDDKGRLLGFDQDEDALANVPDDKRFVFVNNNFRYLKRYLKLYKIESVDGILADLGVSSHQLDVAERGFSYRGNAELDMRMNQLGDLKASAILNRYPLRELQSVFSKYGEVRNAKTLAEAIVAYRGYREFHSIEDLLGVVGPLVRGKRSRYLSQLFQALRIEVNDEMGALQEFLLASLDVLRPGGRLVVISYHSVEDRIVKNLLKTGNVEGEIIQDFYGKIERPFRIITKKPVLPDNDEIMENPRSRSARLRVGEKKTQKYES
ncbi:MAG: 16S rRNA (cytosine(1402)-N(4))-methyltransferase RsmH [Bacteroidetes bacterium]|nr:16S rRNA (cytosine(1402)-N(4))-methyltransferase RsmH [Bacteroidota bacterium]